VNRLHYFITPGRKELDAQWQILRRGWYVGDASFLEKLEGYPDAATLLFLRASYLRPRRFACLRTRIVESTGVDKLA
jgi:hypothetical protein